MPDFIANGPTPAFTVVRSGDPVARLPAAAAAKLEALRVEYLEASAITQRLHEQMEEVRTERGRLQIHINRLKTPLGGAGGGFDQNKTEVAIATEQAALDKTIATYNRLAEQFDIRSAQSSAKNGLVRHIEQWIGSSSADGILIVPFDGKAAKLLKGELVTDAVERTRNRRQQMQADLHTVRSTPLPSAVVKAAMRAQVAEWSEIGRPDAGAAIEQGAEIYWPLVSTTSPVATKESHGHAFVQAIDPRALLAWWDAPGMIARLEAEIDAVSDDAHALDDKTRAQKESALLADILTIEREECSFIEQARAKDLNINYRIDTDPRAVLNVELVVAEKASPKMSDALAGLINLHNAS